MRLLHFLITKIPKDVMKNLFHPKCITLTILLGIFVIGKCNNPKL